MTALHFTVDVFGAVALVGTFVSVLWVAMCWIGWHVGRARARRARPRLVSVPDRPCRPRPAALQTMSETRRTR